MMIGIGHRRVPITSRIAQPGRQFQLSDCSMSELLRKSAGRDANSGILQLPYAPADIGQRHAQFVCPVRMQCYAAFGVGGLFSEHTNGKFRVGNTDAASQVTFSKNSERLLSPR